MRKTARLIHRYSNRKMYDTVARAFITLGQVMAMIGKGTRVRVIERASGIDVTNLVRIRAIANETVSLARRMAGLAAVDGTNLSAIANEMGRLGREMTRLGRLVKKEARDGG